MAKFDPTRTPGAAGVAPPPGAPIEVTRPGSERPTAEQVAQARRNEQDLPVYAPKPMSDEAAAAYLGKSVDEIQRMRGAQETTGAAVAASTLVDPSGQPIVSSIKPVDQTIAPKRRPLRVPGRPMVEVSVESAPAIPVLPSVVDSPERQTILDNVTEYGKKIAETGEDPDLKPRVDLAAAAAALHERPDAAASEPYRPAASDTDSPSRGVPVAAAALPKSKQITGGFGDVGEAQYYPLDGLELGKVVDDLLQQLRTRIKDDLRFSIAATYPRVNARVEILVECFAADHGFQIKKVMRPHDKTAIDIARAHADECCFVVSAQHVEMTDAGESVTPPDAIRLELDLPVPRKQAVQTPGGKMIVDVRQ